MKLLPNVTAEDVFISVLAQHDEPSEAYRQLGDCMTKRQITNLLAKAETNEWQWCSITVRADFQTEDGREYSAETYLGACSYKSRIDFIKNSGYYEDMVAEVLEDINSQIAA